MVYTPSARAGLASFKALQLAAAAQGPVGGDQAGGDPGGPELEVEGLVGIKDGGGVTELGERGDQILATSDVDLAIIARNEGRAVRGRDLTRRCGCRRGLLARDFRRPTACYSRSLPTCNIRRPTTRKIRGPPALDEDAKVMRAHD